ncbi:MAG: alpha/beta hydrolase [Pseudomonadales bacterium]
MKTIRGMCMVWITRPLIFILTIVSVYFLWALYAYRDIPVAQLESRYGGTELQVIDVDGVPVRYKMQGSGPAVVLIHSHYFDMGMWDAWVDELAQHYTVLRYDMSSHGLTGPDPSNDYSMERNIALLTGLMNSQGINAAHIVGSSLGGNIAFHTAAFHPERVRSLVLVNSGGLRRKNSRGGGEIPDWIDTVAYFVPTVAFRAFLEWMMYDDTRVSAELAERFHEMFRRQGNRTAEFERMRQFDVGDPDQVLALVKAPVFIQWGEENPQLPKELAGKMADSLTQAKSVETKIYTAVGHVLPVERPAESVRDVMSFFRSVDGGK